MSVALTLPLAPMQPWSGTSSSSAVLASREFLEYMEHVYVIRNYMEVSSFLLEHPYVISILAEAYRVIQRFFGLGTTVALEVMADPETEDYRRLVASIKTSLRPREAIAKLEEFDRAWWLSAARLSRGVVCVHVEYR